MEPRTTPALVTSRTCAATPIRTAPAWRFNLVLVTLLGAGVLADTLGLTGEVLDAATTAFGRQARARLQQWQHVVDTHQQDPDLAKLEAANRFINRNRFLTDLEHWGIEDYWATPVELIGTRAGDCEDFTLAKYFTLRAMSIDDTKLRIIYVNAVNLNQAHMVLGYYSTPSAEPLVLDNLVQAIKPASMRLDLKPVYSFVGSTLWRAKVREHLAEGGENNAAGFAQVFLSRLSAGTIKTFRSTDS